MKWMGDQNAVYNTWTSHTICTYIIQTRQQKPNQYKQTQQQYWTHKYQPCRTTANRKRRNNRIQRQPKRVTRNKLQSCKLNYKTTAQTYVMLIGVEQKENNTQFNTSCIVVQKQTMLPTSTKQHPLLSPFACRVLFVVAVVSNSCGCCCYCCCCCCCCFVLLLLSSCIIALLLILQVLLLIMWFAV